MEVADDAAVHLGQQPLIGSIRRVARARPRTTRGPVRGRRGAAFDRRLHDRLRCRGNTRPSRGEMEGDFPARGLSSGRPWWRRAARTRPSAEVQGVPRVSSHDVLFSLYGLSTWLCRKKTATIAIFVRNGPVTRSRRDSASRNCRHEPRHRMPFDKRSPGRIVRDWPSASGHGSPVAPPSPGSAAAAPRNGARTRTRDSGRPDSTADAAALLTAAPARSACNSRTQGCKAVVAPPDRQPSRPPLAPRR